MAKPTADYLCAEHIVRDVAQSSTVWAPCAPDGNKQWLFHFVWSCTVPSALTLGELRKIVNDHNDRVDPLPGKPHEQ